MSVCVNHLNFCDTFCIQRRRRKFGGRDILTKVYMQQQSHTPCDKSVRTLNTDAYITQICKHCEEEKILFQKVNVVHSSETAVGEAQRMNCLKYNEPNNNTQKKNIKHCRQFGAQKNFFLLFNLSIFTAEIFSMLLISTKHFNLSA